MAADMSLTGSVRQGAGVKEIHNGWERRGSGQGRPGSWNAPSPSGGGLDRGEWRIASVPWGAKRPGRHRCQRRAVDGASLSSGTIFADGLIKCQIGARRAEPPSAQAGGAVGTAAAVFVEWRGVRRARQTGGADGTAATVFVEALAAAALRRTVYRRRRSGGASASVRRRWGAASPARIAGVVGDRARGGSGRHGKAPPGSHDEAGAMRVGTPGRTLGCGARRPSRRAGPR